MITLLSQFARISYTYPSGGYFFYEQKPCESDAEQNNVPTQQFVDEFLAYIRSSECPLSATEKRLAATTLESALRTAIGSDPKLYGKTLDDKDFDWEGLRGKYVLVQFTATWCGPCHLEVPGMLEAYKKYHDKDFEIVSVYIWERGTDPVASVKEHVERSALPWIIISEALTAGEGGKTERSLLNNALATLGGQRNPTKQGDFYAIRGVPTMLLVDKAGKIIMTNARGEALQTKLAEIFE